ncbi:MAG: hypothetical protein AAF184_09695 [Pseudomonadota bacterium]
MARSRSLLDIFVGLSIRSAKFKAGLTDAEKAAQRWQKKVSKDIGGVQKSFAGLQKIAGGLAAVLVGRGVAQAVGEQVRLKAAAADTARFLGIGTEAYSKFTFAADQFGVQQNQVNLLLQRMTRNVSEAAIGVGEARNAFRALNLDAAKLRNLQADKQFEAIADALSKIENQGDRIAVARKIFDSEGAAAALRMAEGFRAAADRAEDLGVTLSEKAAANAVKARRAFSEFSAVIDQMTENVALPAAIAITKVAQSVFKLREEAAGMSRDAVLAEMEKNAKRIADIQRGLNENANFEGGALLAKILGAGPDGKLVERGTKALAEELDRAQELQERFRELSRGGGPAPTIDLKLLGGAASKGGGSDKTGAVTRARDRGREAAQIIEGVRLEYASEAERLHAKMKADIARVQQAAIEGLGLTPDAANARFAPVFESIREGYEEDLAALTETAKESEKKIGDFSRRARENIQDIFAQGFEDAFDGGLKRMGASFARFLKRLLAQALAAKLTNAIFGSNGSGGGGGSGFLPGGGGIFGKVFGSVFGQSHATNAFAGKAYRVEPGRPEGETFVPGMDGRFMLDSQLFGGGDMSLALNVGGSTVHVHGGGSDEQVNMFRQELAASEARQRRALDAQGRQILSKVRDERRRRRL